MTPHSLFAPARRVGQGLLRTQADDRLVDLARSGSEPAFEAIVARYRRQLLRYCARLVSEQRAEEAVQETFVRAYGALMRGEEVRTLKPWLYRIAHNSALNSVRSRPLASDPLDERVEAIERTDHAAERQEGLRDVVTAVQALPRRQRDAIVKRELEGRSYDEIAVALGVSNGAVRQLLSRARTSLRAGAAVVVGPFMPFARMLAEVGGSSGSGAAAKLCATACLTGVFAGGVAPSVDQAGSSPERQRGERPAASQKAEAAPAPVAPVSAAPAQPARLPAATPVQRRRRAAPERTEAAPPRERRRSEPEFDGSEHREHDSGERPRPEAFGEEGFDGHSAEMPEPRHEQSSDSMQADPRHGYDGDPALLR